MRGELVGEGRTCGGGENLWVRGECISCGLVGDVKRRFYLCVKNNKKNLYQTAKLLVLLLALWESGSRGVGESGSLGVGESGSREVWESGSRGVGESGSR